MHAGLHYCMFGCWQIEKDFIYDSGAYSPGGKIMDNKLS